MRMNFVRLVWFTLLIPGSVTVLFPYLLLKIYPQRLELGIFKFSGVIFLTTGAFFYFWSALLFLIKGGGTPAIWFTRKIRFLIGEEPYKMVSEGLYRISRNPMYLGIVSILLGEALLFESWRLFGYCVFIAVIFHLNVLFIEEPHLQDKFGESYQEYLKKTPRWLFRTHSNKN
ncbi:MAG: isoprenylcysteine carboxylmethyltransferase family protein [Calditrichaeota bacterium]|nr:MAG: isoprenylcysteine carboxylmethyltransferase family protein [Calditrichota bacterium]